MPGPETKKGTDPSLNHPLTMPYMGAGSGWEKRLGRRDFHPPLLGGRVAGRARSKRLRQSRLAQDGIGGMAARNADRHGEIPLGDRAMPDFMAALALPDQSAAGGAQQVAQGPIELRGHSGRGGLGFAQRGDLQEQ